MGEIIDPCQRCGYPDCACDPHSPAGNKSPGNLIRYALDKLAAQSAWPNSPRMQNDLRLKAVNALRSAIHVTRESEFEAVRDLVDAKALADNWRRKAQDGLNLLREIRAHWAGPNAPRIESTLVREWVERIGNLLAEGS